VKHSTKGKERIGTTGCYGPWPSCRGKSVAFLTYQPYRWSESRLAPPPLYLWKERRYPLDDWKGPTALIEADRPRQVSNPDSPVVKAAGSLQAAGTEVLESNTKNVFFDDDKHNALHTTGHFLND
jgi:hypothetical protein